MWYCNKLRFNTLLKNLKLFRKVTAQAEEAGKGSSRTGKTAGFGPGKATGPAPSNKAAFRATLWTNLDQVILFYKALLTLLVVNIFYNFYSIFFCFPTI